MNPHTSICIRHAQRIALSVRAALLLPSCCCYSLYLKSEFSICTSLGSRGSRSGLRRRPRCAAFSPAALHSALMIGMTGHTGVILSVAAAARLRHSGNAVGLCNFSFANRREIAIVSVSSTFWGGRVPLFFTLMMYRSPRISFYTRTQNCERARFRRCHITLLTIKENVFSGQTAEILEPSIVWASPASLRRMSGPPSASQALPKASVAQTQAALTGARTTPSARADANGRKEDGPPKRCTRLPNVAAARPSISAVGACAPSELRVHHHVHSTGIRSVTS